jgi:hypothetical protein
VYEKFIARQPIFDDRLKLFAYELLFRASSENVFKPCKEASSSMIVDSVMLFDLPALIGRAKAFINLDEASLRRGAARLLPSDRVVIEAPIAFATSTKPSSLTSARTGPRSPAQPPASHKSKTPSPTATNSLPYAPPPSRSDRRARLTKPKPCQHPRTGKGAANPSSREMSLPPSPLPL